MTTPPTPKPEKLAELVRSRREGMRLTQRTLAAAAGLSLTAIQVLENPHRQGRARANTIRLVACGLRLSPEDERRALEYAGHDPDAVSGPELGRPTTTARELVALVEQLSPEHRSAAATVIEGLARRGEAVA